MAAGARCAKRGGVRTLPKDSKNITCQNALKTAAQAAKTALADPSERATLEAAFKSQSKYSSLFAYTVAQKYVKPSFD